MALALGSLAWQAALYVGPIGIAARYPVESAKALYYAAKGACALGSALLSAVWPSPSSPREESPSSRNEGTAEAAEKTEVVIPAAEPAAAAASA